MTCFLCINFILSLKQVRWLETVIASFPRHQAWVAGRGHIEVTRWLETGVFRHRAGAHTHPHTYVCVSGSRCLRQRRELRCTPEISELWRPKREQLQFKASLDKTMLEPQATAPYFSLSLPTEKDGYPTETPTVCPYLGVLQDPEVSLHQMGHRRPHSMTLIASLHPLRNHRAKTKACTSKR